MPVRPGGEFNLQTVDKLLTTTRAVRRRLDLTRPVPIGVVRKCLDLALQAPTGSNAQTWRWVVVADPEKRRALAELYQNPPPEAHRRAGTLSTAVTDSPQQRRVMASARFLIQHMHEVPLLVVPCVLNAGGAAGWGPSIYPAVWSFMLALRSRGLGSVITTAHLYRAHDAAALLGIPKEYVQACMVPVAFYTGDDFRPAVRRPLGEVAFLDSWGASLS
jgi:nitroreductase